MAYKQPRSVQVVIFFEGPTGTREFLLLKRLPGHGGFWQPVTGSLEEGESHAHAAVREVQEETGLPASPENLIELGLINLFEIAEQWRPKYAPGVTHNEEVCFALRVSSKDVQIDTSEHQEFMWTDYQTAFEMLYWDSSRVAFAAAAKAVGEIDS
jgi:dATP pyrophosphohydrolase